MTSDWILSVAVPRPLDGLFTYRVKADDISKIEVGGWVKVPFGKKSTHAFIVEPPKDAKELSQELKFDQLKEIEEIHPPIFSSEVLDLCRWAHEYYFAPLGEVLHCAAPPAALGLKNKKEARTLDLKRAPAFQHEMTAEQKAAFEILENLRKSNAANPKVALLDGVTGSGKTELYIELAKRALAEDRGVLLLVPEIALTSQLHHRFEEGLGVPVALWHSAMADGKRRDEMAALLSGDLRVVVGARSAVFAPVRNLGLIVIDEEHDPTYKQEDRVRYHARDLAVVRSKISGATVILGSATPSLETRERVREGRYQYAQLKNRIASSGLPTIQIVDLFEEERVENTQALFAKKTIQALQETLDAGEQAMVFLNRRGFASFLICKDCSEVRECPNCSVSLTVHKKGFQLRCHVCGHQEPIPDFCAKCQNIDLQAVGAGTESLEEELPKLLTGAKALRLDRDQITSATKLDQILEAFRKGEANLLLGTQMLVKGHDFPGVTLVVVVLADALFRWPDFRAPERGLQVLKQVSGRAGRGTKPGRVLIQTFDPEHPVLQTLRGQISESQFLGDERELRQALKYPPFGRMARLRFESPTQDDSRNRSGAIAKKLTEISENLDVLGPSEAFLERAKGIFRWDVLLKATDIRALQKGVLIAKDLCRQNRWPLLVDIDPYGVG